MKYIYEYQKTISKHYFFITYQKKKLSKNLFMLYIVYNKHEGYTILYTCNILTFK